MFLRSGCMSLVAVLLPQSMLMLKLRMENSCGTKKKSLCTHAKQKHCFVV